MVLVYLTIPVCSGAIFLPIPFCFSYTDHSTIPHYAYFLGNLFLLWRSFWLYSIFYCDSPIFIEILTHIFLTPPVQLTQYFWRSSLFSCADLPDDPELSGDVDPRADPGGPRQQNHLHAEGEWTSTPGGHKEKSSILADQLIPRIWAQMGGGGGRRGISANE